MVTKPKKNMQPETETESALCGGKVESETLTPDIGLELFHQDIARDLKQNVRDEEDDQSSVVLHAVLGREPQLVRETEHVGIGDVDSVEEGQQVEDAEVGNHAEVNPGDEPALRRVRWALDVEVVVVLDGSRVPWVGVVFARAPWGDGALCRLLSARAGGEAQTQQQRRPRTLGFSGRGEHGDGPSRVGRRKSQAAEGEWADGQTPWGRSLIKSAVADSSVLRGRKRREPNAGIAGLARAGRA